MDSWVRFNTQSQGKERVLRAAQYACMLLGYTLHKSSVATDLQRTISELEAHMSLTRKLLRLGNSVEALQAAKTTIHLSDSVLRLCLTIGHLNRAMYFACDNVVWAGKIGIISKLDQQKWNHRSFRYYLFALILNVTRDVYELCLLLDCEDCYRSTKSPLSTSPSSAILADQLSSSSSSSSIPVTATPAVMWVWLRKRIHQIGTVLYNNPPLLLDLLKNGCDIFIPLDKLGIYQTGPGFVGTCGLLSSVLSIVTMLHPWLKLKP
ncbi:PREDICTED: peroxisomal membrane protein 11B isoform X1 [Poecilia mexicana]|uniref:Peroxisomal biogenesis factor 11 beta n=2 Tax=Poecilia mexicana TaxID=48701 RepID=A0A3B3Y3V8_9TELE|nr:PREDICTED: peroxisomal membrane protein 11B isoform X1 [Poecilia formosa]XP_014830778.1 PREDICTED: peroxisomal membrane protein 11B isoform X1 [Poecilia mexicana]